MTEPTQPNPGHAEAAAAFAECDALWDSTPILDALWLEHTIADLTRSYWEAS